MKASSETFQREVFLFHLRNVFTKAAHYLLFIPLLCSSIVDWLNQVELLSSYRTWKPRFAAVNYFIIKRKHWRFYADEWNFDVFESLQFSLLRGANIFSRQRRKLRKELSSKFCNRNLKQQWNFSNEKISSNSAQQALDFFHHSASFSNFNHSQKHEEQRTPSNRSAFQQTSTKLFQNGSKQVISSCSRQVSSVRKSSRSTTGNWAHVGKDCHLAARDRLCIA